MDEGDDVMVVKPLFRYSQSHAILNGRLISSWDLASDQGEASGTELDSNMLTMSNEEFAKKPFAL